MAAGQQKQETKISRADEKQPAIRPKWSDGGLLMLFQIFRLLFEC